MASALYEPYAEEEKKRKAQEEAARRQAAQGAFSNAASSSANDIRRAYYDDLQRQYGALQSQYDNIGGSSFWGGITGGNDRRKAAKAEISSQMSALQSLLAKSGAAFGALDAQQGPAMTAQMAARLKALEQESQASSLAEDPLFQGDRAMLVQGGQQALSGVANKRLGYGATGGFSNIGSISDIYDRLGAQLSQLGQDSRKVKETKRDAVAAAYQAFDDAQREFQNAQAKAEAAIISGNIDQAYQFMQAATQAEVRMREAQANFTQNLVGSVLGKGVEAAAYGLTGGAAAAIPAGYKSVGTINGNPYAETNEGALLPGTPVSPSPPYRYRS